MSTFAASTCSRVACQTSLREIDVRRGRSASIRFDVRSIPIQSPTAGRPSSRTSLLAALARCSPSSWIRS